MRVPQLALRLMSWVVVWSVVGCGGTGGGEQTLDGSVTPPPMELRLITSELPRAQVGVPYSAMLVGAGGRGGYSWEMTGSRTPPGLQLGIRGTPSTRLSGTPMAASTSTTPFSFIVKLTDSDGTELTKGFSLIVDPPDEALRVHTTSVAAGRVGSAYRDQLEARGGAGAYRWSVAMGELPAGLRLSTAGTLTGTPTVDGAFVVDLEVKDGANATATRPIPIIIREASTATVTITTTAAPDGIATIPYRLDLAAAGGRAPYTWSLRAALPAGLVLRQSGTSTASITGRPTVSGPFTLRLRVRDAEDATGEADFPIDIAAAPRPLVITTARLPDAVEAQPYAAVLQATGGAERGYTWTSTGALPPGLVLTATRTQEALLQGTPTATGTFAFRVVVTDVFGFTDDAAYTVRVAPRVRPIQIATTSVAPGARGEPYRTTVRTVAGTGTGLSYNWEVTPGTLPPGLALSSARSPVAVISGQPTASGTFTATITVIDGNGARDSQPLVFEIITPLVVATTELTPAQRGAPYQATLQAVGGSGPPYTWSVARGPLPRGLALHPDGELDGVPTVVATTSFTVQVQDGAGRTAIRILSLQVVSGLTIVTLVVPDTSVGDVYSAEIAAVGGTSSGYTWDLEGSFPPGLQLDPTGTPATRLHGIPTTEGTVTATVTVTDSGGNTDTAAFTITVRNLDRWVGLVGDTRVDGVVELSVVGLPGRTSTVPTVVNPIISGGGASESPPDNQLSPDGTQLAFVGDFVTAGVDELFVVELGGAVPGPARRVSGPLIAGGGVVDFAWSPDGTRLAYSADQDVAGVVELYLVDVTDPLSSGPVPVSPALVGDVTAFRWSPDGGRLSYLADQRTVGVLELFVVDVNGPPIGAPLRVNVDLPAGADVDARWLWTPDGGALVYQADQSVLDQQEIFLFDVTDAQPAPVRLNGALIANGDVGTTPTDVTLSPDGDWVAYVADQVTDAVEEVFVVNIAGTEPSPSIRVSGAASAFTDNLAVVWSPTEPRLVYASDQRLNEVYEVFLVDLRSGRPLTPVKIHPDFPATGRVANASDALQWSPDGMRVAYRADTTLDNQFEVEVVDLSGPAPGLPLDAAPQRLPNRTIDGFAFAPDSSAIAARGEGATDERDELFVTRFSRDGVPVPNPAPVSVTGASPVAGGQVIDFVWADGRYVVVRGDLGADGVTQAYLVDTRAPVIPPVPLFPALPVGGDVTLLLARPR